MGLTSSAMCFNEAALLFKRLDTTLGDKQVMYQETDGLKDISSLDILTYGYLKYLLVNANESKEAEFLKTTYPRLVSFVQRLDTALAEESSSESLPQI